MDRLSPASVASGPPSKRQCVSSPSADSPRELGQMRSHRDTGSGSAHFVGSGSGIYFVRTVRRAFASNSAKHAAPEKTVEDELVPGEDDQLDPPTTLWRGNELKLSDHNIENGSCNFDDLVLWSKSYFDSWHPPFPFLHAPTVLGMFEKLSTNGLDALDHGETVILRSIMSISAADRRQLPESHGCVVPSQLVYHSTDEAIFAIQPLVARPSSLPSLQAVVSVQVFLISMLRLNAASRIGGLIVRMALHLGLHRCPARFEQFSSSEVDIRKRLFWSIYSIDRYLSQSLGLPLDLKDDDCDVCYHDMESHQSNVTGTFHMSNASPLLLPSFLAKHGRIKGLILELRNKSILHSNFDPDEQAHIDAEISQWWNAAQDVVDPIDDSKSSSGPNQPSPVHLKSSHRLLLMVQKHESVILLNRPVITSGYNTSAFGAAMQKCIGASKAIITNIYRHCSVEAQGTSHGQIPSPLVWPGYVWMVWQAGLILLYAASEGHYSPDIAHREASRCISILEHLALRGTFWPNSCAAVIKELQLALRAKSTDSLRSQANTLSNKVPNSSHPSDISSGSNFRAQNNNKTLLGRDRPGLVSHPVEEFQSFPNRIYHQESQHQSGPSRENESPSETQHQPSNFTFGMRQSSRVMPPLGEIGVTPAPDAMFQSDPKTTSTNFAHTSVIAEFGSWENMFVNPGPLGDFRDQSYDIFQLMDPSYLLSGQITPAQVSQPPGIPSSFGHAPTDPPENYQP